MNGANVDYASIPSSAFSGTGEHLVAIYDPSSGGRALGKMDVIVVVERDDHGVMFSANYSVPYYRDSSSLTIGDAGELSPPLLVGIASGISVAFDASGTNIRAHITLGALATGTYQAAVYFDGKGFML